MSAGVEDLLTSALGRRLLLAVEDFKLDKAKRRKNFVNGCQGAVLACPACAASALPLLYRLRRLWRHLDGFRFEALLHCDVPRIACAGCGISTQSPVPWARRGSGLTAAFEALALALCRELLVRQAAESLRCPDKQLLLRFEFIVNLVWSLERLDGVRTLGIDETSLLRPQSYITVVHGLGAKRLQYASEGRDHQSVLDLASDLKSHDSQPDEVNHVCMGISAAYTQGVGLALPHAHISCDRFHVITMANEAMVLVRRDKLRNDAFTLRAALGPHDCKTLKQPIWCVRRNPACWGRRQTSDMHWLQHSRPKSGRAWRMKVALQQVYAYARAPTRPAPADAELHACLSWARRSRLEPVRKMATTLKCRIDAAARGMTDRRNNAFVEAMNGLLKQAKRVAGGFRTAPAFIAVAYLRVLELTHFPTHRFSPVGAR